MGHNLLNFLEAIRSEKHYETLVIFVNEKDQNDLIMENLFEKMPMQPLVLINEHTKYEYREKFNSEILLLRYLKDAQLPIDFKEFQPFPVRTNIRLLLISPNVEFEAAKQLTQYCNTMKKYQIIDILAISNDFEHHQRYLRCSNVTSGLGVEQRNFSRHTKIFEERLLNLNGATLRIMVDLLQPRTMWDRADPKHPKLIGYVGKLLSAFAHKHNATLYSITGTKRHKTIHYNKVVNIAHRASLIDIGAVIVPNVKILNSNFDGFSYAYELTSYCFMVPIPHIVPVHEFYVLIVKPIIWLFLFVLMIILALLLTLATRAPITLRTIFLNDKIIRGMLSQSFPMPWHFTTNLKFIIMITCYTSIMVNAMYLAYLQTLLTHPPIQQKIATMDDLTASGLKLLVPTHELDIFRNGTRRFRTGKLPDFVEITDDFDEFLRRRNTLNDSYIYPVTYTRWLAYAEQQELFARKMFYYMDQFSSVPFMFQSLPLPKNSRYMEALNRVIMQVNQAGLSRFWITWNFYDLVRIKLSTLEDLSVVEPFADGIELLDLYWIWFLYLGGISVSLICFIFERLIWYQQKKKDVEEQRFLQNFIWLD